MARLNNGRFILSGTLRFDEPFLIGGVDVEAGLDTSPMFDGNGCALVPGTSLAGVLRSWISTQVVGVSADDIEQVFGGNDSTSGASRIHIDDVALRDVENSGLVLSTVDGVGIDRVVAIANVALVTHRDGGGAVAALDIDIDPGGNLGEGHHIIARADLGGDHLRDFDIGLDVALAALARGTALPFTLPLHLGKSRGGSGGDQAGGQQRGRICARTHLQYPLVP